jgi:hypothetical protein
VGFFRKLLWIAVAFVAYSPAVWGDGESPRCETVDYLKDYQKFRDADPATYCKDVDDDQCAMMDNPDSDTPPKVSACTYAVNTMRAAVEAYKKEVDVQCGQVNHDLNLCATSGQVAAIPGCLHDAYSNAAPRENNIKNTLDDYFSKIALAKKTLDDAIEKFKVDSTLPPGGPLNCGRHQNGIPRDGYLNKVKSLTASGSPLLKNLSAVQGLNKDFQSVAHNSSTHHQQRYTTFLVDANSMFNTQKGMGPADPTQGPVSGNGNKSDVTGTGDSSPSIPSLGGGGGSSGDSGGSNNANPSADKAAQNLANSLGSGAQSPPTGSSSSSTAQSSGAQINSSSGGAAGSSGPIASGAGGDTPAFVRASKGLVAGRDLASSSGSSAATDGAAGVARTASAGPAGAGGDTGGAALGDAVTAASDKKCQGKDCGSATAGLVSSQFAPVGSLGALSSLDSLPALDTGPNALDNLLKDDKAKGALGGFDSGMAGLDSAMAGLSATAEGSTESTGIAGSNAEDLFVRMHAFHVRAQKRGMIVGLTRKL